MEVETLGQALDGGWRIHMRCSIGTRREGLKIVRPCPFRCELDVETLVCTRGRDCPLSVLVQRLRCPYCGARDVIVSFTPPAGGGAAQPVRLVHGGR